MSFDSSYYFVLCLLFQLIPNVRSETFDYEDAYTLNYYFPMILFFVVNFIIFLSGCTLFGLYLREEKRSEILKGHRENQERLAREAAIALEETTIEDVSIEDEITVNEKEDNDHTEERLKIDDISLALDATSGEVEIALAK